jgi:anti-anti-sigma regulatory factor
MTEWKYEKDGLSIYASKTGARALVCWRGVSDSRSPGTFLNPFLLEIAQHLKDAEVTVDFTKLDYMNSATVAPLVNLIRQLDENGKAVLVLFSDVDWQRTHMKCMTAIARTLHHVRIEGRPSA